MENAMAMQEENLNEINNKFQRFKTEGRIEFITFHPSYTYEEFIEGITVEMNDEESSDSSMRYVLKSGIVKIMCKRALGAAIGLSFEEIENMKWKGIYDLYLRSSVPINYKQAPRYVLIIDEINRGNISKIFGELITLLEADKRIGMENELIVTLPSSNDLFGVPANLYIVSTMNTADRSIALVDVALRRRFGFIEMNPDFDVLTSEHIEKNKNDFEEGLYGLLIKSKTVIMMVNEKICKDKSIGRDKQIGHSFLFKVNTTEDLVLVWRHEILPLLEEYFYSDYTKLNRMLFDKDSDTEWLSQSHGIGEITASNLYKMLDSMIGQ